MMMRNKLNFGLLVILLSASVAGCMYKGEGIDNAAARKVTWFSFLAGDDIKASCHANAPDQVRVVYNGQWREQVRIYELGLKAPRQLDQRVIGTGSLTSITTDDLLAPWRGATASASLPAEMNDQLMSAFADSGAFGPPAIGLQMPSDGYYWTAASCYHGSYHFTAWLYPQDAFQKLTFPKALLGLDATKVAFNEPHPIDSTELVSESRRRAENERWYIKVGANGLVGN
ncbi:MAG TPA: hypothetical protein VK558_00170 [Patescibacteria group bacterium]|nr:hypothetical protein [Patescibacteria group bacterium]